MSLNLRLSAARRALLAAVDLYAPVHHAVTADARMAFERAMDEIQAAHAEGLSPELADLRERIANWESTARSCGFEGLTEALGHLLSLQGIGETVENVRTMLDAPPGVGADAALEVHNAEGAALDTVAAIPPREVAKDAQTVGSMVSNDDVQDGTPPPVPPPPATTKERKARGSIAKPPQ